MFLCSALAESKMDSVLRVVLLGQVFQQDQEFPRKEQKQKDEWLRTGTWICVALRQLV